MCCCIIRSKSTHPHIRWIIIVDDRYRDFGDKVQYEGPYDFHTEVDMSKLLNKLKHIRATGGKKNESFGTFVLDRFIPSKILALKKTAGESRFSRKASISMHISTAYRRKAHNKHAVKI